jgi:hypothetical protein
MEQPVIGPTELPPPQQQHQLPPAFAALLGPWEAVPAFAPPPADQQAAERIRLLVKHCIQSGAGFLQTVRERQANDPGFSFLFNSGDPAAISYWKWLLYANCAGITPEQPPYGQHQGNFSQSQPLQPQTQQQTTQLSPEMEAGFSQVLSSLTGAKVWACARANVLLKVLTHATVRTARHCQWFLAVQESIKNGSQWFIAAGPGNQCCI